MPDTPASGPAPLSAEDTNSSRTALAGPHAISEHLLVERRQILLICGVIQAVVERAVQRRIKLAVAQNVAQVEHRASFEAHMLRCRGASGVGKAQRSGFYAMYLEVFELLVFNQAWLRIWCLSKLG